MGEWAQRLFGKEKFDRVGLAFAGTWKPKYEKQLLKLFDKVVSSNDRVFHGHLVKKDKHYYPILTNIYGAPAMVDSLAEIYDGGCRNLIFFGYAYAGFKKSLEIGSVVIPSKSYHFDGIYSPLDPSRTLALPNRELRAKLKEVFKKNGIKYYEGKNISVPAVTFQLPHNNKKYKKINPLTVEMELASCFSRARDIGMRTAGILIISDNRTRHIHGKDKVDLIRKTRRIVLKCLVENLTKFDFPNLKTKREFDIDEHLANIIEDPEDVTNVYRRKK